MRSYREYASKEFVDEFYVRKSDEKNIIRDFIILRDASTGYLYNVYMKDGILSTSGKIIEIKVNKMPDKLTYIQGEKFDSTGMEVIAIGEDGSIGTINDFDVEYVLNSTVNIYYTDKFSGEIFTTSIEVEVTEFDPVVQLIDFEYTTNEDGTYTLTGWKQTLNGEPSTEMIIPDNNLIIL